MPYSFDIEVFPGINEFDWKMVADRSARISMNAGSELASAECDCERAFAYGADGGVMDAEVTIKVLGPRQQIRSMAVACAGGGSCSPVRWLRCPPSEKYLFGLILQVSSSGEEEGLSIDLEGR